MMHMGALQIAQHCVNATVIAGYSETSQWRMHVGTSNNAAVCGTLVILFTEGAIGDLVFTAMCDQRMDRHVINQ